MMEAVEDGAEEVLLFNEREELTEAAACNVFIVSGGAILPRAGSSDPPRRDSPTMHRITGLHRLDDRDATCAS